jgi:hypothetical protein
LTSPKRRRDRPIQSVALKISLRADRDRRAKIKELIPSAQVRGGVCQIRIEADEPAEVAERARVLLEKLRTVV